MATKTKQAPKQHPGMPRQRNDSDGTRAMWNAPLLTADELKQAHAMGEFLMLATKMEPQQLSAAIREIEATI